MPWQGISSVCEKIILNSFAIVHQIDTSLSFELLLQVELYPPLCAVYQLQGGPVYIDGPHI